MNTEEYWRKREKEHRKVEDMTDREVNLRTQTIIYGHFGRMVETLESFYRRYAEDEGITLNEAKKRISNVDMERYEALAQYYVKNRDDKDLAFSKEANKQMKLYNVTMKTNREKLLMAEMVQHLKNLGGELEVEMREYLDDSTIREFERQAGMLGNINVSQRQFNALINSTHLQDNVNWDTRLWKNLKAVQQEVDNAIHDSLIRGIHPDKAVKRLRELTGRTEYEARRLLLTETTRAQSEASLLSLSEKKIASFKFYAQIDNRTTKLCRGMHEEVIQLKDAKIGLNVPPLHQFCRSGIAPNISPESIIEEGGGIFNIFNDEDNEDDEDYNDEEFEGDDEGEDLLDELDGLLDRIEAKTGIQKVRPEVKKKMEQVIEDVPEEPKPLQPVFGSKLKDNLTATQHEELIAQFNKTNDERTIDLFNKYGQDVGHKTLGNGAHYSQRGNYVGMAKKYYGHGVEGEHESEYSRVFYHEIGHALDYEYNRKHRGRGGAFTVNHVASNGKTLEDTMKDEWKSYEKSKSKEMKELTGEAWKIADVRDMIRTDMRKNDVYLWKDISDMIEGATMNKLRLGWGHGLTYWKRGKGTLSKEIFAELYSMMITSIEAYEFTKQFIPETVAIFEEMLALMVEEKEE